MLSRKINYPVQSYVNLVHLQFHSHVMPHEMIIHTGKTLK